MNLWQTHQETLIAACYQTSGPIIELGTGDGSTPLLHSTFPERLIISVDTKIEWLQKFFYLASQRHFFMLVKDFTHFELPVQHAGVLFIDSAPAEQRPMCINRFASMADLIVVHDTELPDPGYCWGNCFDQFKHVWIDKRYENWTTVVSQSQPFKLQ